MAVSHIVDALLAAGAATRLTRFVVTEDLGGWVIRHPAQRWADPGRALANRRDDLIAAGVDPAELRMPEYAPPGSRGGGGWLSWKTRLVSGLDCPFCVGTWLHIAAQASTAILPRTGPLRTGWRVLAGGLTASYVAAHLMIALGDFDDDE